MKYALISLILATSYVEAAEIEEVYWSTMQCSGYIYHFNPMKNEYKIYSKIGVEEKGKGKYNSYQLSEGNMKLSEGSRSKYHLVSQDTNETARIDFSNMDLAVMTSSNFGEARLIQCDELASKKIIAEAEKHFEKCSKRTVNCKSL